MISSNRHLFALYVPQLHKLSSDPLVIEDKALIHRITRVLRLGVQEKCILFDKQTNLLCELDSIGRNELSFRVVSKNKNRALQPEIILLLPLLKKDDLSKAVYSAVEMGATTIRLIITDKSRKSVSHAELERLERIIIAAAEQSKQFCIPDIKAPLVIDQVSIPADEHALLADPAGKPVFEIISKCTGKETLWLMVGPEGGLIEVEQEHMRDKGFVLCRLTPTIVRSFQASSLLIGICRSFFQ